MSRRSTPGLLEQWALAVIILLACVGAYHIARPMVALHKDLRCNQGIEVERAE